MFSQTHAPVPICPCQRKSPVWQHLVKVVFPMTYDFKGFDLVFAFSTESLTVSRTVWWRPTSVLWPIRHRSGPIRHRSGPFRRPGRRNGHRIVFPETRSDEVFWLYDQRRGSSDPTTRTATGRGQRVTSGLNVPVLILVLIGESFSCLTGRSLRPDVSLPV